MQCQCYTYLVPTKDRRYAITETPLIKSVLDELCHETVDERVALGELAIFGANTKLAELRAERDETAARRRRLAERIQNRETPTS